MFILTYCTTWFVINLDAVTYSSWTFVRKIFIAFSNTMKLIIR